MPKSGREHPPKFADCECTQPEEKWVIAEAIDEGRTDCVVYRCETCGEVMASRIPLFDV